MSEKSKVEILIADDDGSLRGLLASIIRSSGYHSIVGVSNGQEVVKLLENKHRNIRIAFLDIEMPMMNGLEVLQHVKSVRPECFCVMVSGHSSSEPSLRPTA